MSNEDLDQLIPVAIRESKPANVQQLVEILTERSGLDAKAITDRLLELTSRDRIKVKAWRPESRVRRLIGFIPPRFRSIGDVLAEPVVKAIGFVAIVNVLAWIILLVFPASVALQPFRIVIVGIDLLFSPGFLLVSAWHPPRLHRTNQARSGDVDDQENKQARGHQGGFIAVLGFSICYSIALVVILGFILGLAGVGFNILLLKGIFTLIEAGASWSMINKLRHDLDPYGRL
jgi:hypothetical protein